MQQLMLENGDPTQQELEALESRAVDALKLLTDPKTEVRLPLFVEMAGSPKSGKSTVIGIVSHFFKRQGFSIACPPEGASLRTPPALKDDLLGFNVWSACYALQHILVDAHQPTPEQLVMLDRGLFDAVTWMKLLAAQNRITADDRESISRFLLMDLWRERENCVFLFTANFKTSLSREQYGKLTSKEGRAMNPQFLASLLEAYEHVGATHADQFPNLFRVDTSFVAGKSPGFQRIAYVVTSKILDVIFELTSQILLVTDPVAFDGFVRDSAVVNSTAQFIADHPRFLPRSEAEKTLSVQQVVPYALLKNDAGKYFWAKRRSEGVRSELAGKFTLLVGGHADKRDANGGDISRVFERCLRRELDEELMGFMVQEMTPLGFIHDTRNKAGSHHLAYIHEVRIGGTTAIRRQASDQEFGRESVEWKSPEEIANRVKELDPWSQLIAKELFGADIPITEKDPTLFEKRKA